MIRMNIVMKSGALVEVILESEERYLAVADDILSSNDVQQICTEGYFPVYINGSEVAAISAELLEEDDDDEASDDDDEEASGDEEACYTCDEVSGSEACENCGELEAPNT